MMYPLPLAYGPHPQAHGGKDADALAAVIK
jgi:hypothetical protein